MEATWMSIDRWMDKEDMAYIYTWNILSHKKENICAHSNEMDKPRDYYTKWSNLERKKKYWILTSIYGI